MVVVGSRKAVRWKLAIDKYITEGLHDGDAFSGEVSDKESGPDPFTEKRQSEPRP